VLFFDPFLKEVIVESKKCSLYQAFLFAFETLLSNIRFFMQVTLVGIAIFLGIYTVLYLAIGFDFLDLVPEFESLRQCVGFECVGLFDMVARYFMDNALLIGALLVAVGLIISAFMAGYAVVMLQMCDQGSSSLRTLFAYIHLAPKILVAWVLYYAFVALAGCFLILPGLIVMARLGLWIFFIVDKNQGIIESFISSYRVTRGFTWELIALFGLTLVTTRFFVFNIIGALILLPDGALMYTYVYRQLSE
jgi:hypothetical protein